MLIVVAVMLVGVLVGLLLRKYGMGWVQRIIMGLIWLLLFLLGLEVGSNKRIIGSLQSLGLEALLISFAGIVGTVLAAWLLWRCVSKEEEEKS